MSVVKGLFSHEKIEVSVVNRVGGRVQYRVLQPAEVDRYCKKAEDEKVLNHLAQILWVTE